MAEKEYYEIILVSVIQLTLLVDFLGSDLLMSRSALPGMSEAWFPDTHGALISGTHGVWLSATHRLLSFETHLASIFGRHCALISVKHRVWVSATHGASIASTRDAWISDMYGTFSLAWAPTNASQGQWIRMVSMLGEMADPPSGGRVTVYETDSSAGVAGVGFLPFDLDKLQVVHSNRSESSRHNWEVTCSYSTTRNILHTCLSRGWMPIQEFLSSFCFPPLKKNTICQDSAVVFSFCF